MNPAGDSPLLVVAPEAAGLRIDTYLTSKLDGLSRTRIQRSIEDGDILVNDGTVKSGYRVSAGDKVEIDIPPAPPIEIVPEAIPLDLVYEDDDLIVVDKPAGLVVHPGAGNWTGTLVNALVYHFDQLSGAAGRIRPGIVHRIDKDTSGLLVVAKNDPAHERLSDEFRDRQVSKAYIALVYGRVKEARGEIETRIGRSPNNRTRMAVVKEPRGRTAHTTFEMMQQFSDFSLLRVRIATGRTHQIRVHMAHIGHPVVADAVYGTGREKLIRDTNLRRAVNELGRHFLHSAELAFRHPLSGEQLSFTSPIPPKLASFLQVIT
jgi:23S rRNA pseudouridine1911/1915/1917 synthase